MRCTFGVYSYLLTVTLYDSGEYDGLNTNLVWGYDYRDSSRREKKTKRIEDDLD